ncbi:TonB-dependent receptor plug domain-containing protein [Marinicella gelatinilytica]|uniref:TonB-dependent receptor plug domain-containing protein n=1 Tax=Marinicella gelatinilytica TaxID=2996017 RepID=UPI002260E945|nr:TonB-dependent receptor [Marinicella gelatinilytica]MCX7545738.1 TonB-dependent receptor [Marinicella gelatinilytica]
MPYSLLSGVLLVCLSFLVSAETDTSQKTLSPLVVTAGLTPIDASDYGGTLTVIDGDEISASGAVYLSELLRSVPGFAVNQSGGIGTQTQVRIRGAEANHVLVLRDGVRLNDATGNDEFLFNYALLDNIERIEIIRGPQSAVWGTDALGAVINIISRQADNKNLQADLEYGSFNSLKTAVSGAYASSNWRLNGAITGVDSGGSNISLTGDENDGYENLSARLSLDNDWTDSLTSTVRFSHSDAMNEYDGTDFMDTGLPMDADLWTERTLTTAMAQFRIKPKASSWHSRFDYHYSDTQGDNFSLFGQDSSTAAETHEFKVLNSWGLGQADNQRINVMLDHRQVDFSQVGTASNFGDPNQSQSYHVSGVAAEFQGVVGERFTWQASARHDDFNRFDDVDNYQLAGRYQLNEQQRIRATLGSGSKAPSFIERFGYFPAQFIGNPDLKPEESTSYELAYEIDYDGHQLAFIYFNQDLTNEIDGFVYDVNADAFTARNKDNDSQRSGVEVSWLGQWTAQLSSRLNYTYTDASEKDAFDVSQHEVRRPKHVTSLTLNYDFADQRGRFYSTVRHQSSQLDNFYSPSTYLTEKVRLDGYTTVSFNASWAFTEKTRGYIRADNLFDEDYQEVYGYARPGAGFYIGVNHQFF